MSRVSMRRVQGRRGATGFAVEPRSLHDWFGGRRAVLATRHGKERVIAPPLAAAAGIETFTLPDFDTDRFGAFTREIERCGSQIDAARAKAHAAADLAGADLALASEGAFGPHPDLPFAPGNLEIVLLVDRLHGLEIVGQSLTTEVRWVHGWAGSVQTVGDLARRGGFPTHAMVVRRHEHDPTHLIKGIADAATLCAAAERLLAANDGRPIFVESDLRAQANPTRMANIRRATLDLLENMARFCPVCAAPGVTVADIRPGLPCRWCRLPTRLPAATVYRCARCGCSAEEPAPEAFADPGQCAFCNP